MQRLRLELAKRDWALALIKQARAEERAVMKSELLVSRGLVPINPRERGPDARQCGSKLIMSTYTLAATALAKPGRGDTCAPCKRGEGRPLAGPHAAGQVLDQ